MPTPHIAAAEGDFAPTVLMPGDPLRARHIATTHLDDARQVTAIRAMEGWTGTYQGTPVSVMGSGMGIPSASIYATELARHYGVPWRSSGPLGGAKVLDALGRAHGRHARDRADEPHDRPARPPPSHPAVATG